MIEDPSQAVNFDEATDAALRQIIQIVRGRGGESKFRNDVFAAIFNQIERDEDRWGIAPGQPLALKAEAARRGLQVVQSQAPEAYMQWELYVPIMAELGYLPAVATDFFRRRDAASCCRAESSPST